MYIVFYDAGVNISKKGDGHAGIELLLCERGTIKQKNS